MKKNRMRRRWPDNVVAMLLVFMLVLVAGCATNPVTGKQDFVLMSESEEISLGRSYHQQVLQDTPLYTNQRLADYVNEVGQRVAKASHRPGLDYHFYVLDSTQINAFALPGGYIYVTRGLLAYLNSEAQLAAVLGHEVGHVTARHSVRQYSAATASGVAGAILEATTGVRGSQDLFNVLGKALLSGYGREHELESDRLGAQYLARTGYDPKAMLEVIAVLKNQEIFERQRAREEGREARVYHGVFATHPDNDRRLQEVVAEANQLKTGTTVRTGREDFLNHLDGLAFGESEREGVIQGNRFVHGPLDFGLRFPQGWRIENQSERLLAIAPGEAALLEVKIEPLPGSLTPQRHLQQIGLHQRDTRPLQLKGFEAYTTVTPVTTPYGKRSARFSLVYDQGKAVLFTGVSRENELQRFDRVFQDVARSYHKLDSSEKKLAKGHHLQLIKATSSTRFADLARKSPLSENAESLLRLINAYYPKGEPVAGQTIKIVR